MRIYIDAAEAGASLSAPARRGGPGRQPDPDRSSAEAARRARGQIRRYCSSNRLNRLGTLTYAGEGCHDARALRRDVGGFFRRMRRELGGDAFPYLWVPEWHPGGHGLHVHFAVGRFIPPGLHRYEVAQGFAPFSVTCEGQTVAEVIKTASIVMDSEPSRVWHSSRREGWLGPPACWLSWGR